MNTKNNLLIVMVMVLGTGCMIIGASEAPKSKDVQSKNITNLIADGKTDLKIRFVESFDTMRQCEQGVECGKTLEKTREQLSKAIQEDEQKITQKMTEFQSKASTLSASARENEEKKLRKMKTEYDTKLQESEYEMKLAMQKTTEELAQDMEKAVVEVAKKEKLDAVVDTVTGRVLYVNPSLNITQSVVKEMDKDYRIQVAKNKSAKTETVVASNAGKVSAAA